MPSGVRSLQRRRESRVGRTGDVRPGRADREALDSGPGVGGHGRVHVRGQVRARRDEVFDGAVRVRHETGQRLVPAAADIRRGPRPQARRRRGTTGPDDCKTPR